MPARRPKHTGASLRQALAEQSRGFLPIAEQHERLGSIGAVDRRQKEIADLEGTAAVEVPAWRLALALEAIGATSSAIQAVNASGAWFAVNEHGEFLAVTKEEVRV